MTSNGSDETARESQPTRMLPRIVTRLGAVAMFFALWFAVAGRATWPQGLGLCSAFIVLVVAFFLRLARTDPDLLRERSQAADNVESWDRIVMRVYALFLLALLLVAALDSGRFRWSEVPLWAQAIGWLLAVAAGTIVWHVAAKNTYLSRYARLQEDRGQIVVRDGLYAWIRHPMYLGIILLFWGLPLLLASLWSFIPGAVIMCLFVYRTRREDRMLLEGLEGYKEYAKEVPYRLVPGIW